MWWKLDHARRHLVLLVAWGILGVPTIGWWRASVVWLVFMSWYANFVGHWSSYEAARGALAPCPHCGCRRSDPPSPS